MVLILLWWLLQTTPPPPPVFTWAVPHPAQGAGVVTWQGPGVLTKTRGPTTLGIVRVDEARTVTTEVPGPAPVDWFWRPVPGDLYCVERDGDTSCVAVTAPEAPAPTPLPERAYVVRAWLGVVLRGVGVP